MEIVEAVAFGGPDVLVPREAPDPVPGPGEVVVATAAADTLFVDTTIRAGRAREFFAVRPPYVPGGGVSGEVVAVGDGVAADLGGRRVIAWTGRLGGHGGYAARVVVTPDHLVPGPDGLDPVVAAALLHDGVTAEGLVEAAAIGPGTRVLVVGATGGAGILLVALARAAGAQVVAAVRGQAKADLARRAGATDAVDDTGPGWARRVRALTGGGADVVLDGVGGAVGREAFEAVADGGRFSAHGAPAGGFAVVDPVEAERRGVTLAGIADVQFDLATRRRLAARALTAAAAGRLVPEIGAAHPLARAAAAHAAIEARTVVGKIVLLA